MHVIDVSDPEHEAKRQVVLDVLKEIGANGHPMITVYNKADLASDLRPPLDGFLVSAVTGEGLDRLVQEIVHRVSPVTV
jgi:GTP-binding protein HflX